MMKLRKTWLPLLENKESSTYNEKRSYNSASMDLLGEYHAFVDLSIFTPFWHRKSVWGFNFEERFPLSFLFRCCCDQKRKVFSKINLNMDFHQIELHPDSRDISHFWCPDGLYRYKRLLFGVNMATETFQQIVWQVIPRCIQPSWWLASR